MKAEREVVRLRSIPAARNRVGRRECPKLLGQNQSGDLRPRLQQVSRRRCPNRASFGQSFSQRPPPPPCLGVAPEREVFVIFQPFPDLLQSDRRDETLNTHIHPRIQQRAFHVVLIPVGQRVGPDVPGRSPVRSTPVEQAGDVETPTDPHRDTIVQNWEVQFPEWRVRATLAQRRIGPYFFACGPAAFSQPAPQTSAKGAPIYPPSPPSCPTRGFWT